MKSNLIQWLSPLLLKERGGGEVAEGDNSLRKERGGGEVAEGDNSLRKERGGGEVAQENKSLACLLAAIVGALVFYGILIASFPGFISDDYYVFTRISAADHFPVTLDPGEYFFLFLRPVTHFYFWLQYTLFDTNAFLMKWFGAGVLLCTVAALFFTIRKASPRFLSGVPAWIIAASCIIFAFHRDLAFTVLWISNVNELLAALFYLLAINLLLGKHSRGRLILAVLFFLFSILSKQSGLHLPALLFLFLWLKRKTLTSDTRKLILTAAVAMTVIALLAAVTNYVLYFSGSEEGAADLILRKPFAMAGTTMYMIFPLFGKSLYLFFMTHRYLALAAAMLISSVLLLVLVRKSKRTSGIFHRTLLGLLFTVIIFFPRILAGGGDRLNAIQLLWLMLLLSILVSRVKHRVVQITVIVCFILQNALSSFALISELKGNDRFTDRLVANIRHYQKTHSGKLYVVPSYIHSWHLPYYFHFLKTGSFGMDHDVVFSAVYVQGPFGVWEDAPVTVLRDGNILTVRTDGSSPANLVVWSDGASQVISRTISPIRGYSELRIQLPDSLRGYAIVQSSGDSLIEK